MAQEHRPSEAAPNEGGDRRRPSLSALELVANHTLDLSTVALLWLALERHSSLLVVAGPRLAGKTTVLEAVFDLVSPLYQTAATRGHGEDFSILQGTDPPRTYIKVNEISDHLPRYLWGPPLIALFRELERGYGVVATMHAESPEEALDQLRAPPLDLPQAAVARIDLIVVLALLSQGDQQVRRLVSVNVMPLVTGTESSLSAEPLVIWDPAHDVLRVFAAMEAWRILEQRLRLPWEEILRQVELRRTFLRDLASQGLVSSEQVHEAVTGRYLRERPQ